MKKIVWPSELNTRVLAIASCIIVKYKNQLHYYKLANFYKYCPKGDPISWKCFGVTANFVSGPCS